MGGRVDTESEDSRSRMVFRTEGVVRSDLQLVGWGRVSVRGDELEEGKEKI